MNKNWLYRILAIALVAMLALPMFAMAEETAIELGADGEATVAEQKLATDLNPWGETVGYTAADAETNVVLLYATNLVMNIDMATDWLDYYLVTTDDEGFDWVSDSLVCTKNSKKSVLTCDKHNHITIKKPGKAVLTLKATNAVTGEKVTIKVTVNVKDSSGFKLQKETGIDDGEDFTTKVWNIALGAPFNGVNEFGVSDSQAIAESDVIALRAVVLDPTGDTSDMVQVDYPVTSDTMGMWGGAITTDICPQQTDKINRIATYKSSSKSVVAVNPFTGQITAKKTGSATITATLYDVVERGETGAANAYAMKTLKKKIKVVKNKSAVNRDMKWALSAAKAAGDYYFGVKQAEYKKIKFDSEGNPTSAELQITFFVANGTSTTQKDIYDCSATVKYFKFANPMRASMGAFYSVLSDAEIGNTLIEADEDDPNIAKGKAKMTWKAGKISTFKKTFKIDVDDCPIVDLTSSNSCVILTEFNWWNRKNHDDEPNEWVFKGE